MAWFTGLSSFNICAGHSLGEINTNAYPEIPKSQQVLPKISNGLFAFKEPAIVSDCQIIPSRTIEAHLPG